MLKRTVIKRSPSGLAFANAPERLRPALSSERPRKLRGVGRDDEVFSGLSSRLGQLLGPAGSEFAEAQRVWAAFEATCDPDVDVAAVTYRRWHARGSAAQDELLRQLFLG